MSPATRKAIIAQAKWDVAQLHEIEKRQRERARVHDLCRREAPTDESLPGVEVTYHHKDKRRRALRERFHTEKAAKHWVWMQEELE